MTLSIAHMQPHTHIGRAHEDCLVKARRIALIQGSLSVDIAQWGQAVWRLVNWLRNFPIFV